MKSGGEEPGTNRMARNSTSPSALKCECACGLSKFCSGAGSLIRNHSKALLTERKGAKLHVALRLGSASAPAGAPATCRCSATRSKQIQRKQERNGRNGAELDFALRLDVRVRLWLVKVLRAMAMTRGSRSMSARPIDVIACGHSRKLACTVCDGCQMVGDIGRHDRGGFGVGWGGTTCSVYGT